jgi:hypothetical protein
MDWNRPVNPGVTLLFLIGACILGTMLGIAVGDAIGLCP